MKSILCATTLALAAATGTASTLFGALSSSDPKLLSPATRGQEDSLPLQPTEDGRWLKMEYYVFCPQPSCKGWGCGAVQNQSQVVGKCTNTYHQTIHCDGEACQILQYDEKQDGCTGQPTDVLMNITADGQCRRVGGGTMVRPGIKATLFATRDEAIRRMARPFIVGYDEDKCSGDPYLFIESGGCQEDRQEDSSRTVTCGADNTSFIQHTWDDSSTCLGNATTTSPPEEVPTLGKCHPANPSGERGKSVRFVCDVDVV